jgi:hypothetical protein
MLRKFWLMPGLEFHKLRAENAVKSCAYALVCPVRVITLGAVLVYILRLT